jgi:hypothetical protein
MAHRVIRERLARLARKAGGVGYSIFTSLACLARLFCGEYYYCGGRPTWLTVAG